jgi:hypothetical protein
MPQLYATKTRLNVKAFTEFHGFMVLPINAMAEEYRGRPAHYEPWTVSVPLYVGDEIQNAFEESDTYLNSLGYKIIAPIETPILQTFSMIDRSVFEVATPETDRRFTKFCTDWNLNPAKVKGKMATRKAAEDRGAIVLEKPSFIVINEFGP